MREGAGASRRLPRKHWRAVRTRETAPEVWRRLCSSSSAAPATGSCDTLDRRNQPTKFTVKGHSGDAEFLEAIRLHEMHHADDHWRAAQAVLAPWDLALQDQQTSNRGHTAPTAAAAKDKVYVEAGGTPDDIATKLDTLWVQLDSDFHASHEGRRSVIKQYSVNADGSDAVGWYDY